jgi:uncharacterized membrane protein YkvA (DUF1232 family)
MTNQNPVPPERGIAFASELIKRLRLVWFLFRDGRVSFWAKLVLPLSLLYLISPVDFIPGALFPIVGGLDDLGVILLGMALFVRLVPQHIVDGYENQLEYGDLYSDDETVDTTYRLIDED